MYFLPTSILGMWFRGLLAVAILAGSAWLFRSWYEDSQVVVAVQPGEVVRESTDGSGREVPEVRPRRVIRRYEFHPGANRETAELIGAVALVVWALLGGRLMSAWLSGTEAARGAGSKRRNVPPRADRSPEFVTLKRPGGAEIHVEFVGPPEAVPMVLTHGWGLDSTAWTYVKQSLGDRYRLILWDLPGLGKSKRPDDGDYRLETLAGHLDAVIDLAGGRPAVLVGHSIGGMIALTYARTHPDALGSKVSALVLTNTTYTDPVTTTRNAAFYKALERPVLVPLMHLTIALSPLVWGMNWLSYWNGSARRSTAKSSFAGTETSEQLDFLTRFVPRASPAVLARGMLGMIRYDATAVPPVLPVPCLVVTGDKDATCLPEASRKMAEEMPAASLQELAPARHCGFFEHHDAFDRTLAEIASPKVRESAPMASRP